MIVSADTDLGTILAMRNTARPSVILFRGATPRNQIGQVKLKILQEVIALSVFVPFAVLSKEATAEARLPVGGPVHQRDT